MNLKEIKIKKTYNTIDELNNSEEFKNLWSGFQMTKEKDYPDLKMLKAYISEDNEIYTIREVTTGKEKGLRFLHKLSIGSCLNNSAFLIGSILYNTIIINTEKGYSRSKENRIKLAEQLKDKENMFVTTSL